MLRTHERLAQYDLKTQSSHGDYLCGVDEVGRGALAGPIGAGAVILPPGAQIPGINDSKKLDFKTREHLAGVIKEIALAWSVEFILAPEIDARGLTWANKQVMLRAAKKSTESNRARGEVGLYIVDQCAGFSLKPHQMMPKADGTSLCVAAAAILAKTARDQLMIEAHERWPQYNWAGNKGYINAEHIQGVREHGYIDGWHRRSYKVKGLNAPIQATLLDFE